MVPQIFNTHIMYKQAIMEALLSTDNNLTKDQLNWAIQNIPSEAGETVVSARLIRNYDHNSDSMLEACGFDKDVCRTVGKEYFSIKAACNGDKKSELIQDVLEKSSLDLQAYLAIRGILSLETSEDFEESGSDADIDQLMRLLKKLGKK